MSGKPREILLSDSQEQRLEQHFRTPEMNGVWGEVRTLLIAALKPFRKGDPVERLIDMLSVEGIHGVRGVRGTLKILVDCPCGICKEQHWIPLKRMRGEVEFPVKSLCSVNKSSRNTATKSNITPGSMRYHG